MEEIVQLCVLCSAKDGSSGTLLDSVFSFMLTRMANAALPQMSALERGALTLQLIFAGGLQHDACRRFIFEELCPAYSTTVLAKQAHEVFFGLVERVEVPSENDENVVVPFARLKNCLFPLHFLFRNSGGVHKLQPPVDFRGKSTVHSLSAVARLWCTSSFRPLPHSLALGELPPGLAAYIVLHHPVRTLRLLQTTVVRPSVPAAWREVWRDVFSFTNDSEGVVKSMHTMLGQGACAKFWPLTLCALVYPLSGAVVEGDGTAGVQQTAALEAFDGASILVVYAMLCLWLNEIKKESDIRNTRPLSFSLSSATTEVYESFNHVNNGVSTLGPCFRCALGYGLRLVERDDTLRSFLGDIQWEQAQSSVVQAAHGLLLSLYYGHSIASHYVRSALDHPEPALFVPSFADLDENDGENHCSESEKISRGGLSFVTALALRLPLVQLYIAERVWRLLESMVASGAGGACGAQRAELDTRLQVLLNSYAFSGLTLSTFSLQDKKGSREGPRLRLRLKRARDGEGSQLCGGDRCSGKTNGVACGNHGDAVPSNSEISLASLLLCNALLDFFVEEFVHLPAMVYSTASVATQGEVADARSFEGGMRLQLATPSHMKPLLTLAANTVPSSSFSAFSSSLSELSPSCFLALHGVCSVLMSVLLYRNCVSLRLRLLREESVYCRAAVTTRLLYCIRRWLRFFGPLGLYRYLPVAEVLLPECLHEIEEDERRGLARNLGAATPQSMPLRDFCGAVRDGL